MRLPSPLLVVAGCLLAAAGRLAAQPVEVIPPELRGAIQPQVAAAADGTVFVVFGKGTNVYCAVSEGGSLQFRAPVLIAALPKPALGMRRGPRIAANDQRVVVSAISHADGNLYRWSSADRGATWSAAKRVNTVTNSAREGLHAMAGDGKGATYLSWLDLRNGKTELWGTASNDGGQTWNENNLIYQSPDGHICECCHPSLAVDSSGNVWAAWRNWLDGARDMYASVSRDGGRTFSSARKLGSGTWNLKACPMDGGNLAFDGNGGLVSSWRRGESIFVARDAGEVMLSATGRHPAGVIAQDGPCYFWQQGSKLMLKRGKAEPVVFAAPGAFVSVATLPKGGSPVIVWESMTNQVKTILAERLK